MKRSSFFVPVLFLALAGTASGADKPPAGPPAPSFRDRLPAQSSRAATDSSKTPAAAVTPSPVGATGGTAVASGLEAQASGAFAVASGNHARATGEHATASGDNSTATNYYATASGWWSTASGGYARAGGFASSASADYANASGYSAIASSGFANAPGYYSAATGWYSTAEGDYTATSGHFSRATGYAGVTGTPGHFSTVEGVMVTPYRTINDGAPEVDLRAYYAAGDEVQLAPAANGYDYVPTNDYAGRSKTPELFKVASVSATAVTLETPPGPAWPKGFLTNLSRGMHQDARGAGTFDNNDRSGDAQSSRYIMRGFTHGLEPVRLTANGLQDRYDNRLRLKWGQAIALEAQVVALSESGAAAYYVRRAVIKCTREGVTSLVGAVQTVGADIVDAGAEGWKLSIAADDTSDSLDLTVIGVEGQGVRWVASFNAVEVAWFPAAARK